MPDIDLPSTEKFGKIEQERALKAGLMKELQELEVLLEKRLRAAELKRMATHTMHEGKVCEHEPSVPPSEPAVVCEKRVTLTTAPPSTPAVSHKLNSCCNSFFLNEAPVCIAHAS